jgi:hypothetical protein
MAKLRAIPGGKSKEKLSLVYGLRLHPAGEVTRVNEGEVTLRDGSRSFVPLHLIEGTREQIRAQLLASIDAFFDIYSDDEVIRILLPSCSRVEDGGGETGC